MKLNYLVSIASLSAVVTFVSGSEPRLQHGSLDSGGDRSEASGTVVHGVIGAPIAGFSTSGTVSIASGPAATLEIVLPEPDESFANWIASLPPQHQPPVDQRGPYDEPARDGMSSLLKYALGLMPMTASPEAAPKLVLVPIANSEQHHLGLELKYASNAAVTLKIEHGGNLENWQTTAFSKQLLGTPDANGIQKIRLVTTLLAGDNPAHFLRLVVNSD